MSVLLVVSPEVAEAVAAGRPVVALETTVVTHGFPLCPAHPTPGVVKVNLGNLASTASTGRAARRRSATMGARRQDSA